MGGCSSTNSAAVVSPAKNETCYNDNDEHLCSTDHVVNKTIATSPRKLSPPLRTINLPALTKRIHPRTEAVNEVMKLIKQVATDPKLGYVTLYGEGGVGKTALMANILTDKKTAGEITSDEINIQVAVWLNGSDFTTTSNGERSQQTFKESLKATTNFDSITAIVTHYKNRVLFILDDVTNSNLLQSIRDDCEQAVCFVITRDLSHLNKNHRAYYHLPVMKKEEVAEMLGGTFELKGNLQMEQIEVLAERCFASSSSAALIIANLIYAHFKTCNDQTAYQQAFKAFEDVDSDLVAKLFGYSLANMKPEQQHCYYAFLLFQPGELVNVHDLGVLWHFSNADEASELCYELEVSGLVQQAGQAAGFKINHQILYKTALARLEEEGGFKVINDDGAVLAMLWHGIEPENEAVKNLLVLSLWATIGSCLKAGRWQFLTKITEKLKPNLLDGIKCFEQVNSDGSEAIRPERNGYLETAAYLKKKYPFAIKEVDFSKGETPLLWSVRNNHFEMLEKMAEIWPDSIDVVARHGAGTTLSYAAKFGNLPIVKFLLKKSHNLATIIGITKQTPLHFAAEEGHLDVVKYLAAEYPDAMKMVDTNGYTPLASAIDRNHVEIAKFLTERCPAAVKMVNERGFSALSIAAFRGQRDLVDLFHQKYSSAIEMVDRDGRTALHWAAFNGSLDTVMFLCQKQPGLIKLVDDDAAVTALSLAAENGHLEAVKFLYEHYPEALKITDKNGKTALEMAKTKGRADVVEFLTNCHNNSQQTNETTNNVESC